MYKRIILKLSGESLKAKDGIIDKKILFNIAKQIQQLVQQKIQVGVVIGGGNIWRGRISKDLNMEQGQADWMGMLATVINSLCLQDVLKQMGQNAITMNAFRIDNCGETLNIKKSLKAFEQNIVVVFGAGTGKTHLSTDTAAAMRALEIKADAIVMGKHAVDGIHDKDPNKIKDAKYIKEITYNEVLERDLKVIDKEAITLLKDSNIQTIVFNIDKPNAIVDVIRGKNQYSVVKK